MGAHQLDQGSARRLSSATSDSQAIRPPSASWHFLIASNDDRLCASVRAALQRVGSVGTFVRSGVEVVECSRAYHPRLVLLDYRLCDVEGLEVARGLRAETQYSFVLIGQELPT